MKEKYLAFQKVDGDVTELLVYGDITSWAWSESDVEAYAFKRQLDNVDTPKLRVRINSYGGEVAVGLAIYGMLKAFKGEVETVVDGFACSSASIIFMAGTKRVVPENGLLMIHNAWMNVSGDHNGLKKASEDLEKITKPSIDIYVSATGLNEETIKEMMNVETWITSQEAYDLGFSTVLEKNSPQQSLESEYVSRIVGKIKTLQKENEKLKNDSMKPASKWEGFF